MFKALSLRLACCVVGCFLAFMPTASASESDEVEVYTRNLANRAFGLLANEGVKDPAKRDEFRILLSEEINTELIGKVVLGPNWRTMTPAQRERFLAVFHEWTISNLINHFGQFQGEDTEIVAIKKRNKDYIVHSLITYKKTSYKFDWRIRVKKDGDFQLIDLVLEGLSIVSSHQSEFRGYLRSHSIEELIERLESDEKSRVLDSLPIG